MANEKSSVSGWEWFLRIVLFVNFTFTSWVAIQAVRLDKDLCTLKATNATQHIGYEKEDSALMIEQRIMSSKLDDVGTKVTQIATKMGIE